MYYHSHLSELAADSATLYAASEIRSAHWGVDPTEHPDHWAANFTLNQLSAGLLSTMFSEKFFAQGIALYSLLDYGLVIDELIVFGFLEQGISWCFVLLFKFNMIYNSCCPMQPIVHLKKCF